MSKKINKIIIPEKHNTTRERVKYLVKMVNETLSEVNEIDQNLAERAVHLGSLLRKLKKIVKKKAKKNWDEFVGKKLLHLSMRTIQRYMLLARRVNLDESPNLAYLGVTRLYSLLELAGDENLGKFLEEAEISTNIDREEEGFTDRFKGQVDELIKKVKKNRTLKVDETIMEGGKGKPSSGGEKPKTKDQEKEILKGFRQTAKAFTGSVKAIVKSSQPGESLTEIGETIKEVEDCLEKLKSYQERLKDQFQKK